MLRSIIVNKVDTFFKTLRYDCTTVGIKVCGNKTAAFFRYFFKAKYGYMKAVNGKDRDFIELIVLAAVIVIAFIISLIVYL